MISYLSSADTRGRGPAPSSWRLQCPRCRSCRRTFARARSSSTGARRGGPGIRGSRDSRNAAAVPACSRMTFTMRGWAWPSALTPMPVDQVEVAFAVGIVDVAAFAAMQHQRITGVVLQQIILFEIHHMLRFGGVGRRRDCRAHSLHDKGSGVIAARMSLETPSRSELDEHILRVCSSRLRTASVTSFHQLPQRQQAERRKRTQISVTTP